MNILQITCKNAQIGYGSKIIRSDLNFDVNKGDYLVVIGENGAGKSTLIKSLLGLIPVLSGELKYSFNKTEIGYLPQQTDIQKDFPASVFEVVVSGCLNKSGIRPFYTKDQKKSAELNIERLGITNLKTMSFAQLSGGQKQRVLLARALCASSQVLLLDEPVSGLDPETTADLYKLIAKLNEEITVIMISHDIHASLEHASHVLSIGKNSFFGTRDEYLSKKGGCSC